MSEICYSESTKGIDPKNMAGFFDGWPKRPTPETLLRVLDASAHRVLALDGERVIGFVTALTDGVLAAYIPFLEVLPKYRGKGVGSELIKRMKRKLKGLYMIDLLCDPELQSFYENLGMRKAVGMMIRDSERQGGN